MSDRDDEEHHLPITSRRIVSGGGRVTRHLTVYCDLRGSRVDVHACEACTRCLSVEPPAEGVEGFVRCTHVPVEIEGPKEPALRATVREVMGRDVVCVTEDVLAETVSSLLLREPQGAVPVVSEVGVLRGLLTETDLLVAWEEAPGTLHGMRAAELAWSTVLVVHAESEATRAAAIMALEGVSALAVVSDDGTVEGVVSLGDIARWVARVDGFIVGSFSLPRRPSRGAEGTGRKGAD